MNRSLLVIEHGFLKRREGKALHGVELFRMALIRDLVQGYFALGGSHVHFNVASADDLRRAKADPERHRDLTVRVSGYSAHFVAIDPRWQDALIERAERGR